jgi:hypothetical protein
VTGSALAGSSSPQYRAAAAYGQGFAGRRRFILPPAELPDGDDHSLLQRFKGCSQNLIS